jgi:hypothetical protein
MKLQFVCVALNAENSVLCHGVCTVLTHRICWWCTEPVEADEDTYICVGFGCVRCEHAVNPKKLQLTSMLGSFMMCCKQYTSRFDKWNYERVTLFHQLKYFHKVPCFTAKLSVVYERIYLNIMFKCQPDKVLWICILIVRDIFVYFSRRFPPPSPHRIR